MTSGDKFNNAYRDPRVLVAPLEWGLGHATRCIPIIKELWDQGAEVLIAANGNTYALLKKEFPNAVFLPLMGYRVKYTRSKHMLPFHLLLQLPKILYTIYNETRWLKKMIRLHKIDAVISDNRFGMYNGSINSIYITHQLLIKTGNRFTEKIVQKIHYRFIKKYNACWVPDFENDGLAGELSHPVKSLKNVRYIGGLSRFEAMPAEKKYQLLIVISGPEPQRTIFETMLLQQLKEFDGNILFVRGLPGGGKQVAHSANVEIVDHLDAAEMSRAIESAGLVISRCGYTTVMDLVKLRKKAILIPTPGQTEQEYLAGHLMKRQIFYCEQQEKFSLANAVSSAASFPFNFPQDDMNGYKKVVRDLVALLKN